MPKPSPIETYRVSPLIFLTLCGVKNSPNAPEPHKNKLLVSSLMAALKLPAAMNCIGMCEISSMILREQEEAREPLPN